MMALLAAARMPDVWAAASAWVPVTDLAAWHEDSLVRNNKYAARSVVARLETARLPFPIDINTGIHDGHTGSVPVSHAIRAFNAVAAAADRIPDADPLYATMPVLLRRRSGPARLTVFDGGHDILYEAALTWLEAQRRGAAATWAPQPHAPPILNRSDAAAGK